MYRLTEQTIERIYAGWLGKIIGIRFGAPIEGWTYDEIENKYGELTDYPIDYGCFAADDDSNGPIFLVRALELRKRGLLTNAADVADALLNYAPYEHGFFWWGGYGISTEHTAYQNLRMGMSAPESGSIRQNGLAIAEQIGGQIFSDCWGLVSPGNPEQAAGLAGEASSVTHDGNAVFGGRFVAACISLAFLNLSMEELLEEALKQIPENSEYAQVVRAIIGFYQNDEDKDWRSCFRYIQENYGYDRYPGACHIIPNIAVMILSLLYGEDDFSKTMCICNMCGWDTDCNAGNVGCIMGVRVGLEGIDEKKWRAPINDLLICSGVMGSLNIMDIPEAASYMAKYAFELAGQDISNVPGEWKRIFETKRTLCHFEYPGSTHALCAEFRDKSGKQISGDGEAGNLKKEGDRAASEGNREGSAKISFANSDLYAHTGNRSLCVQLQNPVPGAEAYLYQKTYYFKEDLYDDRYQPAFSPKIYPGQELTCSVYFPKQRSGCTAQMYVKDAHTGRIFRGEKTECPAEMWIKISFEIPPLEGALLSEAGIICTPRDQTEKLEFYLDDLEYGGDPSYTICFEKESVEVWSEDWKLSQYEITQFTRLKGWTYLEGDQLHLIASDYCETYTGDVNFRDYRAGVLLTPQNGMHHFLNVRVQGAMHSYAVGFDGADRVVILKNDGGYRCLAEKKWKWECGKSYLIEAEVSDNHLCLLIDHEFVLDVEDTENPYLTGAVGLSAGRNSHGAFARLSINASE